MPGLQMCNSKEFFPRNWYDRIIRGITANQITLQVIPLVSIEMWPRIYATGTIDSFFCRICRSMTFIRMKLQGHNLKTYWLEMHVANNVLENFFSLFYIGILGKLYEWLGEFVWATSTVMLFSNNNRTKYTTKC